jgi:hypothetical protein
MATQDEVWREYWRGLRDEWERSGQPELEVVMEEDKWLRVAEKCKNVNDLRVMLRESWKRVVGRWRGESGGDQSS